MNVVQYNGEHSIIINGKNTWNWYRLIPSSRPVINLPEPKTEYVDIPGADGSLDYSEVLAGLKYKTRTGSWEFIVAPGYSNWTDVLNSISADIHGKTVTVVLTDEPKYYYEGRLSVNQWKSEEKMSKVVINYVLDPYKIPLNGSGGGIINPDGSITPGTEEAVAKTDWLWNDLFSNTILYGRFNVYGTKYRNLINQSSNDISVTVTCSSDMSLSLNGETISLSDGTTADAFTLKSGDNFAVFTGNGQVILDYYTGRTI